MLPQRVYAKIDLDAICQNIKNAMDKVCLLYTSDAADE